MEKRTHFQSCVICEAMCGVKIQTQGDKVISIKGDKDDPFSRGYLCPKASAMAELHEDPDRLRKPMVKKSGVWKDVSWDEALDRAAELMHKVQTVGGKDALAFYLGNPSVHNFGSVFYLPRFMATLETRNRFSAASMDQFPHLFASYHMLGHQYLLPIPDIDRTDYMLILGANPLASNGSIMSAPDIRNRLKAVKQRGKLVVIDPRRTETADMATQHHFIKPGSDAALLMAIVHVICHELSPDLGHLSNAVNNFYRVIAVSEAWTPERAADLSGIAAETIREIAHDLLHEKNAVCYGRMGLSAQPFGGLCNWLLNVINILCGNFDTEGGMMFTTPALDLVNAPAAMGSSPGHWQQWKSRVRGCPEFDGELPISVLAEDMDQPGEGQIKGLISMGGNPVLSAPNGPRLDKAIAGLDAYVAIDFYLNETTRHADVILPPVSALQRSHYDIVFNGLAVRNVAKYSPALFEKPENAMEDREIMQALNERLQIKRGQVSLANRITRSMARQLTPERFLSLYLVTMSPYRPFKGAMPIKLSFKALKNAPHGIDLGALQVKLPEQLFTPDKKINLAPDCFIEDLERLNKLNFEGEKLLLIGRRHIRSNNSWMHNAPKLRKGKNLCTLLIHPVNAEKIKLSTGDQVKVKSSVGEIQITAEICDSVMPGVVSIPHGYGHDKEGTRLQDANNNPGVSVNDLTDENSIDVLTGNAALNGGTQVEVLAI